MSRPTPIQLDFRNTNCLWGSVLVETLARLGLRHAVISPGLRSTPLTVAFAGHPQIEAVPVLDERSAAFFALGLARQHHRPVALLCTSGTAGANYFPAVIEAQESGVPLLIITADRPPEMRDCRSGQTIDQRKLYGSHVNFHHELAVPEASLPLLRYLRQTVAHAWERTQWPLAGPVHLNAPFRDPLPPVEDDTVKALRKSIRINEFFSAQDSWEQPVDDNAGADVIEFAREGGIGFNSLSHGIIVVGSAQPEEPEAYAGAIGRLASALGWPVLADALSPVRNYARLQPHLITTYDLIARATRLAKKLKPDYALCVDGWPTSKTLRNWLQTADPEVFMVSRQPQNPDALHARARVLRCSVETLAASVRPSVKLSVWLQTWQSADRLMVRRLSGEMNRLRRMFEGKASALLPMLLPPRTPVFIANSMPVRDAEFFWSANDHGHRIFFNRGANGIDGTLSTALGVAHGNRPAVLLTGDLALLHDANGFLLRPHFSGSLTIVLINNNGGGIFEHLPIARFEALFEKYFATPQHADFRKLCAAHGVAHVVVKSWRQFGELVSHLPRRGIRVLELRTDRELDAAFRQKLFAAAAQTVERALD